MRFDILAVLRLGDTVLTGQSVGTPPLRAALPDSSDAAS